MYTRRRLRIRWIESLAFLLWAVVIACQAMGSTIHSVSLNMNGTLYITNHSKDTLGAVICRVTHNSTSRTVSFRLNGSVLDGTHPLQRDRTVSVMQFDKCYEQPSSPDTKCDEVALVVRALPAINNSRVICDARSRDNNSNMIRKDSREVVTIILKDPVVEDAESPSSSPSPSPSSHPHTTTSSHISPTSTPLLNSTKEPDVETPDEQKSPFIPEGRERVYVGALAGETVALIAAIVLIIFLLCCLCRKHTKYSFEDHLERSVSPSALEALDTKATSAFRPSTELHTSDCDDKEPRYATTCVSDV